MVLLVMLVIYDAFLRIRTKPNLRVFGAIFGGQTCIWSKKNAFLHLGSHGKGITEGACHTCIALFQHYIWAQLNKIPT